MATIIPEALLNHLLIGSAVLFTSFVALMLVWSLLVRLVTNAFSRSRLYFIPEILRGLNASIAFLAFLIGMHFAVLFTEQGLFEHPAFKIWGILIIFVIVNILAKIVLSSVDVYYKRMKTREMAPFYRSLPMVKSTIGIVLYALALLLSIQVVSAEAGQLVSALAVLGIIFFFVIFYEQIRSIAAGFQLTSYYIEEGDLVQLGPHRGFVEGIYGRSTLLRTLEGKRMAIPNHLFFKRALTIHKNELGWRMHVKSNDIGRTQDRISALATKVGLSMPDIRKENKPQVFLVGIENGYAVFDATVTLALNADARKITNRIGMELAKEFREKLSAFHLR